MSEKKITAEAKVREDDTITTDLRETAKKGVALLKPLIEANVRAQHELRREARLLRFEAHRAKSISRETMAAVSLPKPA